jgi:hypothetical protein
MMDTLIKEGIPAKDTFIELDKRWDALTDE